MFQHFHNQIVYVFHLLIQIVTVLLLNKIKVLIILLVIYIHNLLIKINMLKLVNKILIYKKDIEEWFKILNKIKDIQEVNLIHKKQKWQIWMIFLNIFVQIILI